MKQFIKTKYGFSEMIIGGISVYTCKLRFKDLVLQSNDNALKVSYINGYCIASYETTSLQKHLYLMNEMGKVCKKYAIWKLKQKYNWVNNLKQ